MAIRSANHPWSALCAISDVIMARVWKRTPTMVFADRIAILCLHCSGDLSNPFVWIACVSTVAFGAIVLTMTLKVVHHRKLGLTARAKLSYQAQPAC